MPAFLRSPLAIARGLLRTRNGHSVETDGVHTVAPHIGDDPATLLRIYNQTDSQGGRERSGIFRDIVARAQRNALTSDWVQLESNQALRCSLFATLNSRNC